MGSVLRRMRRKAVFNRSLYVPILNAPEKKVEIPLKYRDNLLKSYNIPPGSLTGIGFHVVLVLEGVVFGVLSKKGEGIQITLHLLEMDTQENINLVGAEIYEFWAGLPDVLTFDTLKSRYNELAGLA